MRMKAIRSLRELTRILDVDRRIRRLCLITDKERGYTRSVLSRLTRRVGAERLRLIIEEMVVWLLRRSRVEEVDAILDASFVKAWSTRHPDNSRTGLSDADARVGRSGRSYDLGYKLHVSVDHARILPLASVMAPANENEKRHVGELLDKASLVVDGFKAVVADSQYSSEKVRDLIEELGAEPVIPYMSNQRRGEPVLRVDRFFRVSGPEEERKIYGLGRASVERVNSRLDLVGLGGLKLRGLRNVLVHVLVCLIVMLIMAVAALRRGRPWKARSLSSFWW